MDQLLPDWRARVSEIERLRARVAELEKERNSYIERWVERAAFAEARVAELETVLRAWHSQFGTTQLTHARARLEAAERKAARVAELELESKRDKAHIEALAAEVDAWRDKPMAQELRDLHEKMAVMRARVSELEKSHHG